MEWIYKYIGVTGIITAAGFLIKYLIQKKIDSYFNKKLETYKQELAVITENAKYDISKKLFDFEAYASKKHAVYPELYAITFEFWSELTKFTYKFDLSTEFSKENMDRDAFEKLFYKALRQITAKLPEVQNYFWKNELYLSKDMSKAFEDVLYSQRNFLNKILDSFQKNIKNDNWQDRSFKLVKIPDDDFKRHKETMQVLKDTVYRELSYTHSEEMTEKEEGLSL